ncbi:MAG: tRNA preQ1(34) S-adenosylmethionine ribosyltransferase-isomerase QueA, partial [Gammaproteobacteria bacterium]|nr:tRNA preQ1(34) S-adenosylmethionine ribosyltransferase-isomerase QueA [Gammaproteobacteria bacterium]
ELIAQHPPAQRTDARLLCLDGNGGQFNDTSFTGLGQLLKAGDLLVFNRSRVIPARILGRKSSGGRIELLVERVVSECRVTAQMRASKKPKVNATLHLDGGATASIFSRDDDRWVLDFDRPVAAYLEEHGHIPLPPYIQRDDDATDASRYQTVYADRPGAIAAPTAGLHFDEAFLQQLQQKNIEMTWVTLHVGAGTFQPVRVDDLSQHKMHSERIIVEQATCDAVARTRRRGGRVIAVGTTSVRTLESAVRESGELQPCDLDTRLFIQPGFRFRIVDAMITNFHLPESTLLMLVSAFAGHNEVMQAYAHAVRERYRFFSYGDAMFITRQDQNAL